MGAFLTKMEPSKARRIFSDVFDVDVAVGLQVQASLSVPVVARGRAAVQRLPYAGARLRHPAPRKRHQFLVELQVRRGSRELRQQVGPRDVKGESAHQ